ncbi:MAG: nuclear transport factor 2 family protein [Labilithrix sp.]|nr:nuclear transport factor 2 family protein [Labilithrix sp.]
MSTFEDRAEIRELIERFHDALNHRNFDAIGALFADDGVWEVAEPFSIRFEGRANLVGGIAESVGRLEFLFQSCAPIVVELDTATTARARTSMQEFGRLEDGSPMRVVGTYFDALRKERGTWRFSHRVFRARYADAAPLSGRLFDGAAR